MGGAGLGSRGQGGISSHFVLSTRFSVDRLNVIRIDAANARLRLISSVILGHSVDYERKKFDEKLKEGTFTLERITAWISKAISKPNDIVGGSRLAYSNVHTEVVRSLITRPYKITCENSLPLPSSLLISPSSFLLPLSVPLFAPFHAQMACITNFLIESITF